MQRDNITREFTGLVRQILQGNDAEALQIVERLENRTQGIAPPVQAIQNFTFQVPENSLEEIFTREHYTRAKHMLHYRCENGKNYYNANIACLIWDDPDRVGFRAREQHRVANLQADNNELQRIYNEAKMAQHERNAAAERQPPQWVLCQRTENNDTRLEDTVIGYLDDAHKQVDWHTTIANLHELGRSLGYTLPHYNRVMNRFVTYFNPSMSSIISGMDANETARFLQSLNTPVPDKQRHFKAIKEMHRTVGKELRTIMSELNVRARGYYADQPQAQRESLINNMMIQGLQAFTAGQTNMNLRASIQQQILEDQPLNWNRMQETAILSEETWGKPTVQLSFMPNNQQTSFFNTIPLYNAAIQTMDPLITQVTPLVTPLVCTDPRIQQQQFYTAPVYAQGNENHNGFFNMQNPIMPLQPPVLQQNIPQGNVPAVQDNIQGIAPAVIEQVPQVAVPQPPVVPPQVAAHQAQAAVPQMNLGAIPRQQQQAQALHAPAEAGHQQQAQQAQALTPQQAAEVLTLRLEQHAKNQYNRERELLIDQDDLEDLHALRALAYQDTTPPETPRNAEPIQQKSPYNLRSQANNDHRRNLDAQAFNVVAQTASKRSILSPLIQNAIQTDKKLTQLLQALSVNSTNAQQNNSNMPNGVNPSNRPSNNYRQQTPPRQQNQYNNRRSMSPGGNRDGRNGAPPPQSSNQYRSRTPPYQGNNNYNRQQTPPRYNSSGSYYNNDRGRTPPRDQYYSSRNNSGYNNDRPRSPGYSQSNYQYRPYSPNNQYRQQSPRPQYRPQSPRDNNYRNDRNRSQSPGRNYRDRNQSPNNQNQRRNVPMLIGVNCNPNFTKYQGLMCTKCNTYGKHEEFACPTYYNWAPKACFMCGNGFHMTNECVKNRDRGRTPERSSPKPNNTHIKN